VSQDKLKKLAHLLERSIAHDEARIQRELQIQDLRRDAALSLFQTCNEFVAALSALLTNANLELSPAEMTRERFQAARETLIQINASGRVIQLSFVGTEPLVTSDNLKTPYTLEGSVHWYNQDMLERDEIREHRLYYCIGTHNNTKQKSEWIHYDVSTYKSGPVNADYLSSRLEELF